MILKLLWLDPIFPSVTVPSAILPLNQLLWSVVAVVSLCKIQVHFLKVCTSVLTEVKKEVEEGDEPRAETESESEEELSCFAPTV